MATRLLAMTTDPLYAQIEFGDPDRPDYPDWLTGRERAVSTRSRVAVATRPDTHRPVQVEVWLGGPVGIAALECVWEGELASSQGRFEAGSTTGGHLERVDVTPGLHRVRAYCGPGGPAAGVTEVLIVLGNE
jgi:hypothetical protein